MIIANNTKYTKEYLSPIVSECASIAHVLRRLGIGPRPSVYTWIKGLISSYEIDVSHFNSIVLPKAIKRTDIFIRYDSGALVPMSRIKAGYVKIKGAKCEECDIDTWRGVKLRLEMHHKDCDRWNNIIENLILLCPNCHNISDHSIAAANKSKKLKTAVPLLCVRCGDNMGSGVHGPATGLCRKCFDSDVTVHGRRVTNRPEIPALVSEVTSEGYESVGRKYGVTGNAVKKWMRKSGAVLPTIKTMQKNKYISKILGDVGELAYPPGLGPGDARVIGGSTPPSPIAPQ